MKITITNNRERINKDLAIQEKKAREESAKYFSNKLDEYVLRTYGKGDLYKGTGAIQKLKFKTRVGFKPPAYHAHLVEMGTSNRFINNYRGHKGIKVSSGTMPARPFFDRILEENSDKIYEIMNTAWVGDYYK